MENDTLISFCVAFWRSWRFKVLSKKDMQKEIKRLQKENDTLKRQLRQKATKATRIDAPEKGLPYVKLTFKDQEEPTSDAQYILRRKEVQKEIKSIVQRAELEGITIETEIRRSAEADGADPHLATISEEGGEEPKHNPLVIHMLFQPNEAFGGENLVTAKDAFLQEMNLSAQLFQQA